ncbi:DUF962 domain-containing protein [Zooshikella ganghwensis]|uniref:DUF962 domain-containing protein n=1 Tax=Zooshikella ganghwensis TaxID=202772 RepID=A0A4P9VK26_9GAMM|nr:Mpo1-like protein [Zooshikella ganghwensis]RDH42684.1 DUF962 domain-containing protein [Zooshikella ganghwensis]
MAKSLDQWFTEYSASHQHPLNKKIHFIAVPTIYATVIALLWSIPLPEILTPFAWANIGTLSVLLIIAFYCTLSAKLSIIMLCFSGIILLMCYWLTLNSPWPLWLVALALFIFMWILQFIGHAVEGKKPSFFKDLQFLLIGPAWVMAYLFKGLK